ncbi:MAG: thioesterase [Marinifilaceae bacterium]|jgi:acyl-ACP thioesterase|nr:thioesterase [Marinifilaceae bacterium]
MINKIEELKIKVPSSDTDYTGYLKASALSNFIQEIAGFHVKRINYDIANLLKNNKTWVLSRIRIDIENLPSMWENISIETWSTGVTRTMFGNREFLFKNSTNTNFAKAITSWLIVDTKTKRPTRITELDDIMPSKESIFEAELGRLIELKEYHNSKDFEIYYSDIDINKHVNNACYVRWIIDSLDHKVVMENRIKSIELNYLKELSLGDSIKVEYSQKNSKEIHFRIISKQENSTVCLAKLDF